MIGISERGLHKAIDNNSITAEYLGKIAQSLGVSVGVFFEEKTASNEELNRLQKAYETKTSELIGASIILKNLLSNFAIHFVDVLESYYSNKLRVVDGQKIGKYLLDVFVSTVKSAYRETTSPTIIPEHKWHIATRKDVISIMFSVKRDLQVWKEKYPIWYEYYNVYNLVADQLKLSEKDFALLQSIGVIDKKSGVLLGLLARSNYDGDKFLNLYEHYREIKTVEDMMITDGGK